MNYDDVISKLSGLADEKVRIHNIKFGVKGDQFGVKSGDIRGLAKQIKFDQELGKALWDCGIYDAMLLSTLIVKPTLFTEDELNQMVAGITNSQVADWLNTNIIKPHPNKESLRIKWMTSDDLYSARLGWSLTTARVVKDPDGLDLSGLLDRIEEEMGDAPTEIQWTMNFCLAEIGINYPTHRDRAIAIGEKVGAFRDYPVSKGCTSPFAPIWIAELVKRKG